MEDVRIYDFEFNLLHIEHDIGSCNWTFYENDIGTFEMHFPLASELTNIMMQNKYLVAVQGSKQAIITGKQATTEGVLYGRSCNWLLTRFCTETEFDVDSLKDSGAIASKDAETVCKYILGLAPSGVFTVETNTTVAFGEIALENKNISSIFDLVQSCMAKDGAGHEIVFDIKNKRWIFRMTKGKKLDVILSEGNKNAYNTEYTEDMQHHYSGGWYKQEIENLGEWDASTNTPYLTNNQAENFAKAYRVSTDGTCFDIDFIQGEYILCKNKSGAWEKADKVTSFSVHIPSPLSGIYAWETPLDGTTEISANEELAGKLIEQTTTAKTRGFIFGKDYKLGDIVKVQMKKGDFKSGGSRKITGVELWYESNDIGEQPIMEEVEV